MGWFQQGHDIEGWRLRADGFKEPVLCGGQRTYIWAPAPLAVEVALTETRKARIKRQSSAHIFVCPRLCTPQWLRHLYKAADIVFEVPVGTSILPATMHEPLLMASSSLSSALTRGNWQLRRSPRYTIWEGICVKCSRSRKWTQAIFCANFGSVVSHSNICRSLWCGSCYTSYSKPEFHIHPGD
jgi:hypothetical protein